MGNHHWQRSWTGQNRVVRLLGRKGNHPSLQYQYLKSPISSARHALCYLSIPHHHRVTQTHQKKPPIVGHHRERGENDRRPQRLLEKLGFLGLKAWTSKPPPEGFSSCRVGPLTCSLDGCTTDQIVGFRALPMSWSGASPQPCSAPLSKATRSLCYIVRQKCKYTYTKRVVYSLDAVKTLAAVAEPFFFVATPMTSVAQHPWTHQTIKPPRASSSSHCLSHSLEPVTSKSLSSAFARQKPSLRQSQKDLPFSRTLFSVYVDRTQTLIVPLKPPRRKLRTSLLLRPRDAVLCSSLDSMF